MKQTKPLLKITVSLTKAPSKGVIEGILSVHALEPEEAVMPFHFRADQETIAFTFGKDNETAIIPRQELLATVCAFAVSKFCEKKAEMVNSKLNKLSDEHSRLVDETVKGNEIFQA